MLQVQNIEKYYGSKNNVTKALDRVSFDVEAGEFLAIMGVSLPASALAADLLSYGRVILSPCYPADVLPYWWCVLGAVVVGLLRKKGSPRSCVRGLCPCLVYFKCESRFKSKRRG